MTALCMPTYSMEPPKDGLRKGVTDSSSGAYLLHQIAVRREPMWLRDWLSRVPLQASRIGDDGDLF